MASTMRVEDLPAGSTNTFILTPEYSMTTDTHVSDVLKLIKQRGEAMGVEVFSHVDIVQEGIQFSWHTEEEPDFPEDNS